ncbi:MAG TPA: aminoglycoside phosphotransferase family protein [Glaciibacter sp.]|nr:aminoglycoside phosphotransferase family protein [Glaciibacter sp.]
MGEDAPVDGPADVARWLAAWNLAPDGAPFSTPSSVLAPVRLGKAPGMLKITLVEEERVGNHVMAWWSGNAGAPVLRHDGEALLLERAQGSRSLAAMAVAGGERDDDATRVLCTVAATLHEAASVPDPESPAGLRTLEDWFRDLFLHTEGVASHPAKGFYARATHLALELLADQREVVVLHGDLHHGNVLDFGSRGWRAIDPKGIVGDRAFDYANILCNPNAEVALRPGRLSRQVRVIADAAGLAADRILRWTVAWCGLSATWLALDNQPPGHTLQIGRAAERLLADRALGG